MAHLSPLWERLRDSNPAQKPIILRELCASHTTPGDGDAAQLVQLLRHGSRNNSSNSLESQECTADCFILLARWARRVSLQRHSTSASSIGLTGSTLTETSAMAVGSIRSHGVNHRTGAAAILFLGGYSSVIKSINKDNSSELESLAEVVVGALLDNTAPLPVHVATLITSGTVALLPALSERNSNAACWVFSALLQCLVYLDEYAPTYYAVDALAPLYFGMRSMLLSILMPTTSLPAPANHSHVSQQKMHIPPALQGIYGILRAVLLGEYSANSGISTPPLSSSLPSPTMASAAVLAAGGILEALVQQAPNYNTALIQSLQPLTAGLEHLIVQYSARQGCLIQAACGLALAQTYSACRVPRPTATTATCLVNALFNTALTTQVLEETFQLAASGDTNTSNAVILEYTKSLMVQQATTLLMAALQHIAGGRLDVPSLAGLLSIIKHAASRAHGQYRQYIILSSQEMTGVDVRPLRTVLEKLFIASVEVLATIAALPGHLQITQGALPGAMLSVVSDLQFCRAQTPQYAQLLKASLAALPHQPDSAVEVALCLPPCGPLVSPFPAHNGAPVWIIDGVTAAKVQLLFAAVTPCCQSLPQEILIDSVAPLSILFLRHPHPATSSAAHHALCALLFSAPPPAVETLAPLCIARWLEDQGKPETWNDEPRLQQLNQGLTTVVEALPEPCISVMQSIQSVLGKVVTLADMGALSASAALFAIASQQLFHAHYAQVDEVSEALEGCLRACPVAVQPRLCTALFGVVVASDDCARKPALARWYQNVASKLT